MTKVKLTDRALSEKMYKELVCNNGFTVDFNGQSIKDGFAVTRVFVSSPTYYALKPQIEHAIPFLRTYLDDTDTRYMAYGGWWDKEHNKVELSLTDIFYGKESALFVARERGERYIFNLATKETIKV